MNGRWLRIAFGIVLSVVFLYFSLRGVDLGEAWASLKAAKHLYFFPAMIMVAISFFVRAVRWKVILGAMKPVSLSHAFSATMIGFMANNVLPMRAGELVRALAIGRHASLSRSSALATIVVERIFDMMILLIVLAIGASGKTIPNELRQGLIVVTVVTALMMVGFAIWARTGRRLGPRIARMGGPRWGERLGSLVDSFQDGLGTLGSVRRGVRVFLLSIAVWGFFVAAVELCLQAFFIETGFKGPVFLLGVVSLGVMLPSAPGYIGTMQYFFTLSLAAFAIPKAVSVSASWFYWLAQYIPVTVVGLACVTRENMNLRGLTREAGAKGGEPALGERESRT